MENKLLSIYRQSTDRGAVLLMEYVTFCLGSVLHLAAGRFGGIAVSCLTLDLVPEVAVSYNDAGKTLNLFVFGRIL